MDYAKNVYKGYIIVFFHNLIPAYVIERLFWQDRGMTVFDVVLCEIIYAVTIVISEIPTGVVADQFGRKALLVFGGFLSMLEFFLLLFAYQFWMFACVVFLAGIASACISGAFNALLYDSLLWMKKEHLFEKIIGRLNSFDFLGSLVAALSGSALANLYDFEFNYVLSTTSMLIAFIFTFLLKEPPLVQVQNVKHSSKERIFVHSISFYKRNPKLVLLIVNAMAIGACVNYLDEFWQLYLKDINISVLYFGVFSAVFSLSRIPGNLIAAALIKYMKEESIILTILGVSTVGYFMTAVFPGWIGITMMVIIFFCSGIVDPVITGYLHHHASSHIRATIDSIQSLIERAIMFFVGIGFGLISSRTSVLIGFLFLGAVSLLFLLFFAYKNSKPEISS